MTYSEHTKILEVYVFTHDKEKQRNFILSSSAYNSQTALLLALFICVCVSIFLEMCVLSNSFVLVFLGKKELLKPASRCQKI